MSENLLAVSVRDGFVFPIPISSGVSAPVAQLSDHLIARLVVFFQALDHPKGSRFSWGFSEFLRGTATLVRGVMGSLIHSFCFHLTLMKKVSTGCFPYLRKCFGVAVFPHVL